MMTIGLISLISLWLHAGWALHVYQPYRVVGKGKEATLRCFYQTKDQPEEVQFTLYRGMDRKQEVCYSSFNTSQSLFETHGQVRCRGHIQPGSVDITISGLVGHDTDLYQCVIEVLYPPPYLLGLGNGTLLYIPEELDCPEPAEKFLADRQETSEAACILPWAIFAFIIIIIIIITAVGYKVLTMKYRRREFIGIPPVPPKKLDCKNGYENFL
ncbi:cytotoxic T-lymphocyte protein 4 [Scleropages formosus]|uniref:Cytotoxic T-lymphocyte associated protein 4 n=1 Tax=Scleropages formosus TaxID=113540 RepID=A0A8C9S4B3_SCLFO|nr:cytotoxic T-lymphocyte protein 4-like [Scleropages formosus]